VVKKLIKFNKKAKNMEQTSKRKNTLKKKYKKSSFTRFQALDVIQTHWLIRVRDKKGSAGSSVLRWEEGSALHSLRILNYTQ